MKKGFKEFLKTKLNENRNSAVFTFGRFNPPTTGHLKLIEKLASVNSSNYFVFVSQSQDPEKNPLEYKEKIKFMRQMFSRHGRNIIENKNIKNVFDIAVFLYDRGEKNITMVVGSDRVKEFETLLNKYNGQKARHGFYDFETINVVSAGDRDPDADDVVGMSASKMRAAAKENNFQEFLKGIPGNVSLDISRNIFDILRQRMNIKEQLVRLFEPNSLREKYIQGKLFDIGDKVIVEKTNDLGKITYLGCNYVIVENLNNEKHRYWLTDIKHYN